MGFFFSREYHFSTDLSVESKSRSVFRETLGRQKRSICTGPGAGQGLSFLRNSMQVSTSKCVLVSVTSLVAVRSHLEGWVSLLCAGWERDLLGLAR